MESHYLVTSLPGHDGNRVQDIRSENTRFASLSLFLAIGWNGCLVCDEKGRGFALEKTTTVYVESVDFVRAELWTMPTLEMRFKFVRSGSTQDSVMCVSCSIVCY